MSIFQIFRLFHTYAFTPHRISCLCGIVLVYFQGLVKGPLPHTTSLGNTLLVSPREPKTERFGTTELKRTLVAKFQGDWEPQGPQRRMDLWRPAAPEAVGRPQRNRKLCSCPHDTSAPGSREGTEEIPLCVSPSGFPLGAFSCSLPLRHHACRRTLNITSVTLSPFPLLQRGPSTFQSFRWHHTARLRPWCHVGLTWILLFPCPI